MTDTIPHITSLIDISDTTLIGSRFSRGTLVIYYEDFDNEYEIAVEKIFEIIRTGRLVTINDFKCT